MITWNPNKTAFLMNLDVVGPSKRDRLSTKDLMEYEVDVWSMQSDSGPIPPFLQRLERQGSTSVIFKTSDYSMARHLSRHAVRKLYKDWLLLLGFRDLDRNILLGYIEG